MKRFFTWGWFGGVLLVGALLGVAGAQTRVPIYAAEDTFVLSPGPGNLANYWDGAARNFGYLRSRQVAAATAHPGNNAANASMGEFQAVARFNPSNAVAQLDAQLGVGRWFISGLALKLTTSDNVAGPGLFNAPGTAGKYKVCWLPDEGGWAQGSGYINQGSASHDPVASPENFANLTFNGLQTLLTNQPAVVLAALDFVRQGTLVPVTNTLSAANAALLAALGNGQPITLLLAAADDQVAFNFTSHLYGDDRADNQYAPQIWLTAAAVPPPVAWLETRSDSQYLHVSFQRPAGLTNLTCLVEAAADLAQNQWTFVAGGTNSLPLRGPGLVSEVGAGQPGLTTVTVADEVPVPAARSHFLRIRFYK